MCGISGYLDTGSGVDAGVLRRMTDVIRHRGPDDEGYALFGPEGPAFYRGPETMPELSLPPLEQAEGSVAFLGLGHRRLSILDLTVNGHQPMSIPDQGVTVVYNGEIYNHLELRGELEALGRRFRTSCDTEVLLNAYLEWGEDCLSHFNGMWGFALWDERERKLFCARDRMGVKPFHYWREGDRLLFGSELKQLCQDNRIPRHFNQTYLAGTLMYHISDYNDQTLIQGMRTLLPGHKLVVRLSDDLRHIESMTASPYWQLEVRYDDGIPAGEWIDRVAEEFARSCRWRLRSDAPLAALLSGGLDSSCMVAELCGQLPDPSALQTFTTSHPGRADCDEWDFARMVNEHCGCQGHQICPDPSDGIIQRYETLTWHVEGPSNLSGLGVRILLEDIRDRGFKVVLNGQCGDETMLGYTQYYAYYFFDLLKHGRFGDVLREYRLASRHSALSAAELFAMLFYFNLPIVRERRQLHRTHSFIKKDLLEQRDRRELRRLLFHTSLPELQKTELTATTLPKIVRHDDRLYMSASLESRLPFMDYRFVELACQIPPSLKIKNGYTKHIMREVFDTRLPKDVVWRTNKMGFNMPVDRWQSQFPQGYLLELAENARSAPYFRTDKVAELIRKCPDSPSIANFLQIEVFARQFDVT